MIDYIVSADLVVDCVHCLRSYLPHCYLPHCYSYCYSCHYRECHTAVLQNLQLQCNPKRVIWHVDIDVNRVHVE